MHVAIVRLLWVVAPVVSPTGRLIHRLKSTVFRGPRVLRTVPEPSLLEPSLDPWGLEAVGNDSTGYPLSLPCTLEREVRGVSSWSRLGREGGGRVVGSTRAGRPLVEWEET